eukprot:6173713-Pleurochrysis_carterae.AAC.4
MRAGARQGEEPGRAAAEWDQRVRVVSVVARLRAAAGAGRARLCRNVSARAQTAARARRVWRWPRRMACR